jgi:RNA ligase
LIFHELRRRVEQGYISAAQSDRLTIYNYTTKCVYDEAWDEVTLAARGLVLDDTGQVVARPWAKFFNLNERPETMLAALPQEIPEIAEKYDGSLIVVFFDPHGGQWRAITRGCWDNEQTRWVQSHLPNAGYELDHQLTYMFELVGPWNRIVLNYASTEMILLGAIETATARDLSYAQTRQLAARSNMRAVEFESRPLESLTLNDTNVRDKEGYVARFSNGLRVKMKYVQYLALHKVLTGLSVKGIWELLATGHEPSFDGVPDEFLDWYVSQRDALQAQFCELETKAREIFDRTVAASRKEYAVQFKNHGPLASVLFSMLDGKDYSATLWRQIEPKGQTPVFSNPDL